MKIKTQNLGFSLVELVVATLCLAVAIIAIFTIFNLTNKSSSNAAAYGDLKKEANAIAIAMTKLGQFAGNDVKGTIPCSSAATNVITCATPNALGYGEVRYIYQGNVLTQETRATAGAGTWSVRARYPFVTSFVVCGDANFQANNCPIPSTTLNSFIRDNLPRNRFFRFRIGVGATKGKSTYTGRTDHESNLQVVGAVYVRNPGSIDNVSFVGGRKQ